MSVRDQLIATGQLVPVDALRDTKSARTTLQMDDAGRKAAERHIAAYRETPGRYVNSMFRCEAF